MELKHVNDIEIISEVPENATVLGIVDGSVKRMPSNGLGTSNNSTNNNTLPGILIIKCSESNNLSANMSHSEILQLLDNKELLMCVLMNYNEDEDERVSASNSFLIIKEDNRPESNDLSYTKIGESDPSYYSSDDYGFTTQNPLDFREEEEGGE